MTATVGKAVGRRIAGHQASRTQAIFASVTSGFVAASLTYRWLRSGDEDDD